MVRVRTLPCSPNMPPRSIYACSTMPRVSQARPALTGAPADASLDGGHPEEDGERRVLDVGGADQRVGTLVGNHEDHAPVVVLQDEGVLALVERRQDDVAAAHEADVGRVVQPRAQQDLRGGRSGNDERRYRAGIGVAPPLIQ